MFIMSNISLFFMPVCPLYTYNFVEPYWRQTVDWLLARFFLGFLVWALGVGFLGSGFDGSLVACSNFSMEVKQKRSVKLQLDWCYGSSCLLFLFLLLLPVGAFLFSLRLFSSIFSTSAKSYRAAVTAEFCLVVRLLMLLPSTPTLTVLLRLLKRNSEQFLLLV